MQRKDFKFDIKTGNIPTVVQLSHQIPEFINPPDANEYHKRLDHVPQLILVAYQHDRPVGFKVGYKRDDYFYSWMGGVLPEFRKYGVATALARSQESWALRQGYNSITFKTRNVHKGMLIFALKNGFNIVGFKERGSVDTYRILLRKVLLKG